VSKQLDELLFTIRQHDAFREFVDSVGVPDPAPFRSSGDAIAQFADYVFRSGRRLQHEVWRQFLIGESEQEKL